MQHRILLLAAVASLCAVAQTNAPSAGQPLFYPRGTYKLVKDGQSAYLTLPGERRPMTLRASGQDVYISAEPDAPKLMFREVSSPDPRADGLYVFEMGSVNSSVAPGPNNGGQAQSPRIPEVQHTPAPPPSYSIGSVAGVWDGTITAGKASSVVRFEMTQDADALSGREMVAEAGQPFATVTLDGYVRGGDILIREKELLMIRRGRGWCMDAVHLTLNADGSRLTGRSDGAPGCSPPADVVLNRDWTKTRQWAVCASDAMTLPMLGLLTKEADSPGAARESQAAEVILGARVRSIPLTIVNAHVLDQAFQPGSFTCSVNIARAIDAGRSKVTNGALVQTEADAFARDLGILTMALASFLTENHLFSVQKVAEGQYTIALMSRFGHFSDTVIVP